MSNVITLLLEMNWKPLTYNCWQDPNDKFYVMDDYTIAPHNFAKTLNKWYIIPDLLRAEKHFDAGGILNGIDCETTLSLIRSFKKVETYAFKCTLETILTGAIWTAFRLHESNPEHEPICPRCNLHIEDSLHLLWLCPCNLTLDSENVKNTQKYQEEARTKAYEEPCLWLRGILPQHHTETKPEDLPTHELLVHSINQEEIFFPQGPFMETHQEASSQDSQELGE